MKKRLSIFILFILGSYSFTGQINAADIYGFDSVEQHYLYNDDTVRQEALSIKPFYLDIVAPSSGIQFYRNGIVFLSNSKGDERIPEKHLSFGSIKTFMALVADTVPGPYMPFNTTSSIIFPSEATTFSPDFNTMYLSLIPEKGTSEKIFRAQYSQKGWVIEDKPLNFCKENFIYTHPSLSADGSFMVFASNSAGSFGGLDLYITKKINEEWTDPENLGKQINSTGNELFASLDDDNNLYFSSDGLPGQGGYDVFVCSYNGAGWDKPHNLSPKINSKNDEVAFTVSRTDEKSAFYTERVKSGKERMQLYRVTLNPDAGPYKEPYLTHTLFALAGVRTESPITKPEATGAVTLNAPVKKEIQKKPDIAEIKQAKEDTQVIIEKPETKVSEQKPSAKSSEVKNDLVYRVQILANTKPVGSYNVTIAGKTYKTFEYLYKGGYRTTAGEFKTQSEAARFQNICRQNGYSQSFIAAFYNNERISEEEAKSLENQHSLSNSDKKQDQAQSLPSIVNNEVIKEQPSPAGNAEVIYRVQILANTRSVGSYTISIAGTDYETFEYLYKGGYRTTVGEFKTLKEATRLLNICKQSGYSQAFVVAFRNNERVTDPGLFK